MNKNLTEMVFILDRSGSMSGLETDTIGGYNSLLEKQQKTEGDAVVTTVLFDDRYELLCDRVAIKKVKKLTEKEYYARGATALLDAIGITVNKVSERHKNALESELPLKTMVVIITDGFENSSREYSLSSVSQMIKNKKEAGWEFLFLGANIDAVSVAGDMGIDESHSATYKADGKGTRMNFDAVSDVASSIRCNMSFPKAWKSDIEKHNNGDKTPFFK